MLRFLLEIELIGRPESFGERIDSEIFSDYFADVQLGGAQVEDGLLDGFDKLGIIFWIHKALCKSAWVLRSRII